MDWSNITMIGALVFLGFILGTAVCLSKAESYKMSVEGPGGYKMQIETLGRVVQAANGGK